MTDEDSRSDERYGAFTTGGGDTIVYDRQNPDAWIQSDFAVDIGGDRATA